MQKQKERKRRLLLTYCLSLTGCLSQACLGKMVVSIKKWNGMAQNS